MAISCSEPHNFQLFRVMPCGRVILLNDYQAVRTILFYFTHDVIFFKASVVLVTKFQEQVPRSSSIVKFNFFYIVIVVVAKNRPPSSVNEAALKHANTSNGMTFHCPWTWTIRWASAKLCSSSAQQIVTTFVKVVQGGTYKLSLVKGCVFWQLLCSAALAHHQFFHSYPYQNSEMFW